ncbi:hypothetical protein FOA52_007715 [Chlamydomonas sp. UWO 241]|nr:hypothetical protein FOA52_007715 [Chlamydomonas sp. UWO 241]
MGDDGADISEVPVTAEIAGFSRVWVNASFDAAQKQTASASPVMTPTKSGLDRSVFADGASEYADKGLFVSDPDARQLIRGSDSARLRHSSPNSSMSKRRGVGASSLKAAASSVAASASASLAASTALDMQSILSSTQSSRASSAHTDGAGTGAVPATPRVGNWTDGAKPEPRASRCWDQDNDERPGAASRAAPGAAPGAAPAAAPAPPLPPSRFSPQVLYERDLAACVSTTTNLVGCHAALARIAPPPGEGGQGTQLVRCVVHRHSPVFGRTSFSLHLGAGEGGRGGAFLMAARQRVKSKASSYVISTDRDDTTRGSPACAAKLKANLVGTEYMLWAKTGGKGGSFAQNLVIDFKPSKSKSGPRTMRVATLAPDADWVPTACGGGAPGSNSGESLSALLGSAMRRELPEDMEKRLAVMHNRAPEWDARQRYFTLDFPGRDDAMPSVKNLQLVSWGFNVGTCDARVLLQLCKIGDDTFALDFASPLSPLSAFAVALASVDTKLCYSL